MSSAEILAELPKLKAEERAVLLRRLCELEEADLVSGVKPSAEEKKQLDAALDEFQRDGDTGRPWREVVRDLRSGGR